MLQHQGRSSFGWTLALMLQTALTPETEQPQPNPAVAAAFCGWQLTARQRTPASMGTNAC